MQFAELSSMPKSQISKPSSNQNLSPFDSNLMYDVPLALADSCHFPPPFLNDIGREDSLYVEVTAEEEFLLLYWLFVCEDYLCLEVSCLILQNGLRISCVEVLY